MSRTGKLTLAERRTFVEMLMDGSAMFPERLRKCRTAKDIWMFSPDHLRQERQNASRAAHRRSTKQLFDKKPFKTGL